MGIVSTETQYNAIFPNRTSGFGTALADCTINSGETIAYFLDIDNGHDSGRLLQANLPSFSSPSIFLDVSGNLPTNLTSCVLGADNTKMYLSDSNSNIYSVNMSNQTWSLIGSVAIFSGNGTSKIRIDPQNTGQLICLNFSIQRSQLATFNLSNFSSAMLPGLKAQYPEMEVFGNYIYAVRADPIPNLGYGGQIIRHDRAYYRRTEIIGGVYDANINDGSGTSAFTAKNAGLCSVALDVSGLIVYYTTNVGITGTGVKAFFNNIVYDIKIGSVGMTRLVMAKNSNILIGLFSTNSFYTYT